MDNYGPPELRLKGSYPMGTFESNIRSEMEEKKPERDVFGAMLDDTYRDFYDEFDEEDKEKERMIEEVQNNSILKKGKQGRK